MLTRRLNYWDLWGQEVKKDYLLLARGFVIDESGKPASMIHNDEDMQYFEPYAREIRHRITNEVIKVTDSKSLMADLEDSEKQWNYGMSGPYDYPSSEKASVPLRFLDPGVALFIKVLPLIGIRTTSSCSGHLRSNPTVCFKTLEDLSWIKLVLNSLLGEEIVLRSFKFTNGYGWQDLKLEFITNEEDLDSHYQAYHLAISLGVRILNPETRKILNYFKNKVY